MESIINFEIQMKKHKQNKSICILSKRYGMNDMERDNNVIRYANY